MKFAVIEYSSKSGKIWRHTRERPNYLCDPVTEIDPTSFGCYVSALAGEHIPLTALIHPNLPKKVFKRISGSWPRNYNIDYLRRFEVLLIVHQISDGHEITALAKRIRRDLPNIKVIGVPTQPFGILRDHWQQNERWLADFVEFMNSCDVFLTIVASTKPHWQQLTKSPVVYMPQPYPVEFARTFHQPRASKEKIIMVAGITDRDNIKKGHLVASEIQRRLPEYLIHVTKIDGLVQDLSNLRGAKYDMLPFLPWQKHLDYLSRVALVVNTDYTQTRGRVQADCAAVGTPSIGADSDGQADLFPNLLGKKEDSVDELATQGINLLTNDSLYNNTTSLAAQRLNKYNYENSAQRFIGLVADIRHA